MPTYEYVCTECSEPLEVVQSIHDDSLTQCPSCGGKLRKIFGNVGVVFKGSGFYKNDSRAAASKAKSSNSDAGSSKTPAATSAKDGAAKTGSSDGSGSATTPSSSTGSSSASSTSSSTTTKAD
ncbi:MAG: FmdB family zinc ribbon protein [Candidatus Nanopelagicales bacterium]